MCLAFYCLEGSEADRDKETVRAYFREHLDEAKWEEVRWWPAKQMKVFRDVSSGNNEPTRVIRLKYRITRLVSLLRDEYFEIKDGKASPLADWAVDRKAFPE